jgi:glycosyltransferase involved in cell wall biosynthesis
MRESRWIEISERCAGESDGFLRVQSQIMKFQFVIRYGNLGGTERATLGLVRGLRERGHDCELVFTTQIKGIGPVLEAEHIPYVQLERKASALARYRSIRRQVRKFRPDVIVQVGSRFITTLAVLGLPVRSKVYICHHHHQGEKSRFGWWANYTIVRRAFTSLLFVSRWLRAEAISLNPGTARISHVLYPPVALKAVTTPEMQASARRRLNLPTGAKLIGNAGRLMPVKRFDVFLRVAARVAEIFAFIPYRYVTETSV